MKFRRLVLTGLGLALVAGAPARAQFFFPFFDNRPSHPPTAQPHRPPHHGREAIESRTTGAHRARERAKAERAHGAAKTSKAERDSKAAKARGASAKAEAPPPAVVEGPPPPYEPQLLRLSEIMGALSYLQAICANQVPLAAGASTRTEEELWRDRMQDLMTAEAPGPSQREKLAGAFNRGLRAYEFSYRACTPSAQLARRRFLDEGAQLAHEISTQYRAN